MSTRQFQMHLHVMCLALGAVLLGGCGGPYTLEGRVVQGDFSFITFVDAGDPRLEGPGVANAELLVFRDPTKPNARMVARGRSDGDGGLSMPVAEFGAGWMIEEWRLLCQRARFQTAEAQLIFPDAKHGRRLLVVLAPGASAPHVENELMDQFDRFR